MGRRRPHTDPFGNPLSPLSLEKARPYHASQDEAATLAGQVGDPSPAGDQGPNRPSPYQTEPVLLPAPVAELSPLAALSITTFSRLTGVRYGERSLPSRAFLTMSAPIC